MIVHIPRPLILCLLALAVVFFGGPAIYYWAHGEYKDAIGSTILVVFFVAWFGEVWTKRAPR